MKLYIASTLLSIAVVFGAMAPSLAQSKEYDDLYFNASDRKTISYEKINEPAKAAYDSKGSYAYEEESLSAKNVNPEYVAKYQAPQKKAKKNDKYSSEEYYVEEADRAEYADNRNTSYASNYYGSPASFSPYTTFGSSFYSPFYYDPFYDPFYGPAAFTPYSSRFTMSIGFGFGFGTGWGYNPYRFGYGPGFYDPFYSPYRGFAYNRGFYDGFYAGRYGYYSNRYYCPTPYGGNNVVIVNNEGVNNGRTRYTYGPSYSNRSRLNNSSSTVSNRTRDVNAARQGRAVSNQAVSNTKNTSTRTGRVTTQGRTFDSNRDFSATQNEYYKRSRSNVSNRNTTTRSRSTYSSPATRNDRSVTRDYSNRSYNARPAPNTNSNTRTRQYSSPSRSYNRSSNYSRSRSSSPSRSYSSPSRNSSPSRSYSSPSRSSSSNSGRSYSTPSRSSSSPSRSSGRR